METSMPLPWVGTISRTTGEWQGKRWLATCCEQRDMVQYRQAGSLLSKQVYGKIPRHEMRWSSRSPWILPISDHIYGEKDYSPWR